MKLQLATADASEARNDTRNVYTRVEMTKRSKQSNVPTSNQVAGAIPYRVDVILGTELHQRSCRGLVHADISRPLSFYHWRSVDTD